MRKDLCKLDVKAKAITCLGEKITKRVDKLFDEEILRKYGGMSAHLFGFQLKDVLPKHFCFNLCGL